MTENWSDWKRKYCRHGWSSNPCYETIIRNQQGDQLMEQDPPRVRQLKSPQEAPGAVILTNLMETTAKNP